MIVLLFLQRNGGFAGRTACGKQGMVHQDSDER